jgi:hypothetical protein
MLTTDAGYPDQFAGTQAAGAAAHHRAARGDVTAGDQLVTAFTMISAVCGTLATFCHLFDNYRPGVHGIVRNLALY